MTAQQDSDSRDAARIAQAVRFNAHFRRSPCEKWNVGCATLAEARAAAVDLHARHGTPGGRGAQVYAIGVAGDACFVPASYAPQG